MTKEVSWKWNQSIGLALKYLRREVRQNMLLPHPLRGLKLLSEPCFCYENAIIVCKHGINIGLRHSFHIICTLFWNSGVVTHTRRENGKNWLFILNLLSFLATNPSTKKFKVLFEWSTWLASFPDFFINHPHFAVNWKQLLRLNNRNSSLGLSQDGVCTDLCENFVVNSLKRDLSTDDSLSIHLFSHLSLPLIDVVTVFLLYNATLSPSHHSFYIGELHAGDNYRCYRVMLTQLRPTSILKVLSSHLNWEAWLGSFDRQ